MSWYTKIATNTIYQTVARLASSGTGFFVAILIGRYLGISAYGDFAKVTAYITLFYLVVDFGLNAIFLQQQTKKEKFHELLFTRLALAGLMIIFTNSIAYLLPYNAQTAIGFSPSVRFGIHIFSLTFVTEAMLYSTMVIFQRELSYKFLMIATVVGSLVTLGGVSLSVIYTTSLFPVFVSYLIGGLVESGCAFFFTKKTIGIRTLDTHFITSLFLQTLPVTLMLICNLIYFRIDVLILSTLKSSSDVAIYDFAYKFFDFLIAVPLYMSNAIYPSLLKQTTISLKKYIWGFVSVGMLVVIPSLIGAPLIGLIKHDFAPAVVVFRLLVLSLPLFFITNILQWILLARKKQGFLALVYFAVGVINIILNIIYIPHFSYFASAIITGITEGLVLLALVTYIFFIKI